MEGKSEENMRLYPEMYITIILDWKQYYQLIQVMETGLSES